VRLKEAMDVEMIRRREAEIVARAMSGLADIPGVHLLAAHVRHRLPIFSFYVENLHYNLVVRLLNDRFGIQARGGCSCAGTYGHFLLHVDPARSRAITDLIDHGDLSQKPGWVRLSFHPTSTDAEIGYCIDALREIVAKAGQWSADYIYSATTNEFCHREGRDSGAPPMRDWFDLRPEVATS